MRILLQILEELVIDLTTSERSTLYKFLSLYLGSSFILMVFIAFFYFENEQKVYFDLTKSKMQNISSQLSSKVIYAHMSNTKLDIDSYLKNKEYKVGFYGKDEKKLFGNIEDKIDFNKEIIDKGKNFILTDKSTFGHLGIYYIAVKEHMYYKQMEIVKVNIFFFFLTVYSIIALIGFYLAKLFIKPLKNERDKLNNFIKDTTHELNTPVSAILMSTESETLSAKQVERVRLSAKRVSEIYKDLTYLFLQKDESKELYKTISLDQIIEEQLKYFEPLALKKRVKIDVNIEKFDYKIKEDDFIRVFNNLVSNAIKYNKINGIIKIRLKDKKLIVSDSGIGIEKNKIDDIFKRYYRATSLQGGFGIGLSIVSQIAKKYNIKVEIDSIEKKGTTFTLTF